MGANTASDLRRWAAHIGALHGITLSPSGDGAYGLRTTAGAIVGIEPAPIPHALILTGQIGTADDGIGLRKLKALLALNMAGGTSGTGHIGLEPKTNALLIRLVWTPAKAAWREEAFTSVLMVFAQHVDNLSTALANGQIEAVLVPAQEASPGAYSPQFA